MADSALESKRAWFSEDSLKALTVSLLVYRGVAALLAPVTTSDSQVYDLARLRIAERAGFWQADAWNSVRQVIFPWCFDAIHFPLLKIGWGYALPSWFTFLGLLVIIFQWVAPRFGPRAGFWSIMTLLSMPTLMLQATTTKNDLVIIFGVACWYYSLVRHQRTENKLFIFMAALSLAFTAGSKTSALPICAILVGATGWLLRKRFRSALLFYLLLPPLLFLFGSTETYLLSWRLYQHPLGPQDFVNAHSNQDGVKGAIANFIRYYLANISTGIDGIDCHTSFPAFLQEKSRLLLGNLGLQDAGCRRDFHDANLPFLKDGYDSGFDFGLVGCLAFLTSSFVIWKPRIRSAYWLLDAVGLAGVLITCLTVAWMPWNARFLCLSFTLFGVSLAILVFSAPVGRSWLQLVIGLVIISSAISLPLHCAQRRPIDLWNSLVARNAVSLLQRPETKPVYNDILDLRNNNKAPWFLVASENSWTLPFIDQPNMEWQLTPQWEQVKARIDSAKDSFALVLNSELPKDLPFEVLKTYPSSTYIIKIAGTHEERP